MTILSIDPGIEKTGWAIFKNKKYIISSIIVTKKSYYLSKRLLEIYNNLQNIINQYHPDLIVIENVFFLKNQKTAISIGQAQGIILLLAEKNKIKTNFLTPLQIKSSLTGYGKADKKSIQKMLKLELNLNIKQDDEADAIACGWTYILQSQNR